MTLITNSTCSSQLAAHFGDNKWSYLAVSLDTEELNDDQQEEQRDDPCGVVDALRAFPVVNLRVVLTHDRSKHLVSLTMLQAAEISKGSTVSQLMAYSQAQAKPSEGSTKRQMYMQKAPLIGYKTVISASACIMRYLEWRVSRVSRALGAEVRTLRNLAEMLVLYSTAIHTVHSGRLTNDHETEEDRCGSTALESTTRSNEQTSANGTTPTERQSIHSRN